MFFPVCAQKSTYDAHIAQLLDSNYFLMSPPIAKCGSYGIKLYASDGTYQSMDINSSEMQDLQHLRRDDYGNNVGILST